jgi:hypothetical protein
VEDVAREWACIVEWFGWRAREHLYLRFLRRLDGLDRHAAQLLPVHPGVSSTPVASTSISLIITNLLAFQRGSYPSLSTSLRSAASAGVFLFRTIQRSFFQQ